LRGLVVTEFKEEKRITKGDSSYLKTRKERNSNYMLSLGFQKNWEKEDSALASTGVRVKKRKISRKRECAVKEKRQADYHLPFGNDEKKRRRLELKTSSYNTKPKEEKRVPE